MESIRRVWAVLRSIALRMLLRRIIRINKHQLKLIWEMQLLEDNRLQWAKKYRQESRQRMSMAEVERNLNSLYSRLLLKTWGNQVMEALEDMQLAMTVLEGQLKDSSNLGTKVKR